MHAPPHLHPSYISHHLQRATPLSFLAIHSPSLVIHKAFLLHRHPGRFGSALPRRGPQSFARDPTANSRSLDSAAGASVPSANVSRSGPSLAILAPAPAGHHFNDRRRGRPRARPRRVRLHLARAICDNARYCPAPPNNTSIQDTWQSPAKNLLGSSPTLVNTRRHEINITGKLCPSLKKVRYSTALCKYFVTNAGHSPCWPYFMAIYLCMYERCRPVLVCSKAVSIVACTLPCSPCISHMPRVSTHSID